ncbi:hypothetical protein PGB90_002233 [Kerria lacca]
MRQEDFGFIKKRKNHLPKPVTYFTLPPTEETSFNPEKSQKPRFTYPDATQLGPYGTNVLTNGFYPFKFDIGGLLLGAFVGLGALLLIPKLVHVLIPELTTYGSTYGPYGRNADIMPEGIIQILSQFEKILLENNINSSECLQKAICAYVQSSQTKNSHLRSINLDNDISEKSISNHLVNFLIDGSKFKSAIENGRQAISCSVLYPKCPFNKDSIATGIKHLILNSTTFFEQN